MTQEITNPVTKAPFTKSTPVVTPVVSSEAAKSPVVEKK